MCKLNRLFRKLYPRAHFRKFIIYNLFRKSIGNRYTICILDLGNNTIVYRGRVLICNHKRPKNVWKFRARAATYYICKQHVAARARNFQTFLGRLCCNLRSQALLNLLPWGYHKFKITSIEPWKTSRNKVSLILVFKYEHGYFINTNYCVICNTMKCQALHEQKSYSIFMVYFCIDCVVVMIDEYHRNSVEHGA